MSPGFYYCVVTKQINSNKHYITISCILCNIYSYSYVITITAYQMCPNFSKYVTGIEFVIRPNYLSIQTKGRDIFPYAYIIFKRSKQGEWFSIPLPSPLLPPCTVYSLLSPKSKHTIYAEVLESPLKKEINRYLLSSIW